MDSKAYVVYVLRRRRCGSSMSSWDRVGQASDDPYQDEAYNKNVKKAAGKFKNKVANHPVHWSLHMSLGCETLKPFLRVAFRAPRTLS